jgi:hypothetical protein
MNAIESKSLEVGTEITSKPIAECDACPEIVQKVRFQTDKWRDLQTLMVKIGVKEYAAYLLGEIQADGVPYVHDYYIPEQEVTAVEADILEVVLPADIRDMRIGWLHSHHGMGAFHSGRDEDSMNYPLNVVISHTGYVATYRHITSCGRIMRSKVEIILVEPDRPIPGEEKIRVKTYQAQKFSSPGMGMGMSQEDWDGWDNDWKDGYNQYVKETAIQKKSTATTREYARRLRSQKIRGLLKVGME